MANKQKLAKMMVDFISEYDFYDWSDAGRPELRSTSRG